MEMMRIRDVLDDSGMGWMNGNVIMWIGYPEIRFIVNLIA